MAQSEDPWQVEEEAEWAERRLRLSKEAGDNTTRSVRWAVQESGQKLAKLGMAVRFPLGQPKFTHV